MEKIIGQYWVPGLIDGCFVAGGCSVDYNGPGCDSEEPSEEMGSVSLLNDKRHIAIHSNNVLIFSLIINSFVHKLSISRIAMHRILQKIYILICSQWQYNTFFFREEIANYDSQRAVLGFQNSFFSWVFRVIYSRIPIKRFIPYSRVGRL